MMIKSNKVIWAWLVLSMTSICYADPDEEFGFHLSGVVRDSETQKTVANVSISISTVVNAPDFPSCLSDPASCFMNKQVPLHDFVTDDQGRFDLVIKLNERIDAIYLYSKWRFQYEIQCNDWKQGDEIFLELVSTKKSASIEYLNCEDWKINK